LNRLLRTNLANAPRISTYGVKVVVWYEGHNPLTFQHDWSGNERMVAFLQPAKGFAFARIQGSTQAGAGHERLEEPCWRWRANTCTVITRIVQANGD
jgi:hypothetical protein